jgi:hypothetical protein
MSHTNKQIKHSIPEHLFAQLKTGAVLTPGEIFGADKMYSLLKPELQDLAAKLEKAKKALEFYADRANWSKLQESRDIEQVVMWGDSTEQNEACHYAGAKARKTLEEIG